MFVSALGSRPVCLLQTGGAQGKKAGARCPGIGLSVSVVRQGKARGLVPGEVNLMATKDRRTWDTRQEIENGCDADHCPFCGAHECGACDTRAAEDCIGNQKRNAHDGG